MAARMGAPARARCSDAAMGGVRLGCTALALTLASPERLAVAVLRDACLNAEPIASETQLTMPAGPAQAPSRTPMRAR